MAIAKLRLLSARPRARIKPPDAADSSRPKRKGFLASTAIGPIQRSCFQSGKIGWLRHHQRETAVSLCLLRCAGADGVHGQQIANEIKLCPDCMKGQPTGSPKPVTQSTELNQKVWIFLRTIRHLKGTKGIQLAKDFARKYLTLDQARVIFPNLDLSDVDFAAVP